MSSTLTPSPASAPVAARLAKRAAPTSAALAWVVVVHPEAELAQARASAVVGLAPRATVHAAWRSSTVTRLLESMSGPGVVLVHLSGPDRFTAGWGGHRLVERLAAGGFDVLAWIDPGDVDGRALALAHGATGICCASGLATLAGRPGTLSRAALAQVEPAPRPSARGELELDDWFRGRYARRWEGWMEHAAALLVAGGERTDLAERLRLELEPSTIEQARRRLRDLTDAFCGEIRGNEAIAAHEARLVLDRIARLRPLAATPSAARSLQRAAALVQSDRTIGDEAGLAAEAIEDLLEVAAEEASVGRAPHKRRGRPEAGAWRVRRDLALGRVAERRGDCAAEKIGALAGLRASVDSAIEAIHDVVADRDRDARLPPASTVVT